MKDEMVRLRKILERKHILTGRQIVRLSGKAITTDEKLEIARLTGEKDGLCYALRALDKSRQTKLNLEGPR